MLPTHSPSRAARVGEVVCLRATTSVVSGTELAIAHSTAAAATASESANPDVIVNEKTGRGRGKEGGFQSR